VNVDRGGVEDLELNRPANAVCLGDDVAYIQVSLDGSTNVLMRRSMATGVETVLHESVSPNHLDRSPDASKIAFVEMGKAEARVLTMPASGGAAAVATTTPVETFQLRSFIRIPGVMWRPDGKELLVVRGYADKPDEYAFFRVEPGGGAEAEVGRMRVPHFQSGYFGLLRFSLSPDGKTVAFQQHSGTISQMWAIDNLLAFVQSGATHRAPGLRPAR
jgi:dipeptidyl aminopeptidase/acylaminoacyl peptidase